GDHCHRQFALSPRPGRDQLVQPELAQLSQDGQYITVRQRAQDLEGFGKRADLLAAEDGPDGINGCGGELGEIGQRAMLDLAALAVGLADQDGAVLAAPLAARNDGYVHGAGWSLGNIRIVAAAVQLSSASNGYIRMPI